MPTIGVGRALREQERAAAAARSRPRRRTPIGESPDPEGETRCGGCQVRLALADAYVTSEGARCVACFRQGEIEGIRTSPWSELGLPFVMTLGFTFLCALVMAASTDTPMGARAALGFFTLTALNACSGLYLMLLWLRAARDAFASIHEDEAWFSRVSRGVLAAALTTATGAGLIAMIYAWASLTTH
ncbi:MAG: hypothetical protein AAGA48_41185 [Myxococcota bacterium]